MDSENKEVLKMAKIMRDGEEARERGEIDCSMFTWKHCLDVGIQRLAGAKALKNAGYVKIDAVIKAISEVVKEKQLELMNTKHEKVYEMASNAGMIAALLWMQDELNTVLEAVNGVHK